MFGIGLPEMIVILAVALIVVGPDKLPELARSLAKGVAELKKTVNQVKANLNEEGSVLGEVQGELKKTADDLKSHLLDPDPKNWATADENGKDTNNDIDLIDLQPLEERPWERDRRKEPESDSPETAEKTEPSVDQEQVKNASQADKADKQPPAPA
ncbi:MAG: Sec-independent protein translocase protein TatB [Desulfobulbaceae bacterium]|nr:Sec-independent protein translocase protein TatB [Desulfobulbaceae bacterium]